MKITFIKTLMADIERFKNAYSAHKGNRMKTIPRVIQVMEESFKRSATGWGVAFWIVLAFCFLSTLSLALSLFSFGIVLELQPGWTVWGVFYSYMVAFPLLGIGVLVYFMLIYVKKGENSAKAGLLIVTIPYILIVTAIFAYLIYDIIVNCSQNNDAYCWNGIAIRWQYWWMFISIGLQWVFFVLQIIFTYQVVNAYQMLTYVKLVEPEGTVESQPVSQSKQAPSVKSNARPTVSNVSMYPNNIGLMMVSEFHRVKTEKTN